MRGSALWDWEVWVKEVHYKTPTSEDPGEEPDELTEDNRNYSIEGEVVSEVRR